MDPATGSVLLVIPARLSSTRLPRKLLLAETGKPLIQHTWETARRSQLAQHVIVATEDAEIAAAVQAFGGDVRMTAQHPSGTDRVAEVVRQYPDTSIVVNVQGDEPELPSENIDLVIRLLMSNPTAAMSTLATPIRSSQQLNDSACVKVVISAVGRALWFSRSPIPFAREPKQFGVDSNPPVYFHHIGLYAYRADFLQRLAQTPPSRMEQIEGLEQLRVLETGDEIQVGVVSQAHKGIDTLDDYRAFVARHVA